MPDGRPFFGGTYFPPEDRGNGLVPLAAAFSSAFQTLLSKSREELSENAEAVRNNLLDSSASSLSNKDFVRADLNIAVQGVFVETTMTSMAVSQAPKFLQAMLLNFLMSMRDHGRTSNESRERIDFVLSQTLRQWLMVTYDQIMGVFSLQCRCTLLIPHFEKMLLP